MLEIFGIIKELFGTVIKKELYTLAAIFGAVLFDKKRTILNIWY